MTVLTEVHLMSRPVMNLYHVVPVDEKVGLAFCIFLCFCEYLKGRREKEDILVKYIFSSRIWVSRTLTFDKYSSIPPVCFTSSDFSCISSAWFWRIYV